MVLNRNAIRAKRQDRSLLVNALNSAGSAVNDSVCSCPFHNDRRPSGSIYQNRGVWRFHCHVCDLDLDVFDVMKRSTGRNDVLPTLSKAEIVKRIAQVSNASTPRFKGTTAPVSTALKRRYWDTPEAFAETMVKFQNGTGYELYPYTVPGETTPRLVVVRITLFSKTIGGKANKTFRQLHNDGHGWVAIAPEKPWPIYNQADVTDASEVVMVEGEAKVEALRVLGITATTTPCGAKNAKHADITALEGRRVVVWPDNDDSGAQYGKELVELLNRLEDPPISIKIVDPETIGLPHKGDVVDFIESCGGDVQAKREAVLAILKEAGVTGSLRELSDLVEDQISGRHSLISWAWPMLTAASRSLLPGTVTILAGAPGAAKSWVVLHNLISWTKQGLAVAALELEETKAWHLNRALALMEGSTDLLRSEWCASHADLARGAVQRHESAIASLGQAMWCEGNIDYSRCADWIEERCAAGFRVLIIDPITLADPGSFRSWEADRSFMARAKVAIERSGASLVLVTHPRKSFRTAKGGGSSDMDDLAGGAVYARASASVLWISNLPESTYELVEDVNGERHQEVLHKVIRVLKCRNSASIGTAVGFSVQRLGFVEKGIVISSAEKRRRSESTSKRVVPDSTDSHSSDNEIAPKTTLVDRPLLIADDLYWRLIEQYVRMRGIKKPIHLRRGGDIARGSSPTRPFPPQHFWKRFGNNPDPDSDPASKETNGE